MQVFTKALTRVSSQEHDEHKTYDIYVDTSDMTIYWAIRWDGQFIQFKNLDQFREIFPKTYQHLIKG